MPYVIMNINGKRSESLLLSNVLTYGDPYQSYANTEYDKRRWWEQRKIVKEIIRRNSVDYEV